MLYLSVFVCVFFYRFVNCSYGCRFIKCSSSGLKTRFDFVGFFLNHFSKLLICLSFHLVFFLGQTRFDFMLNNCCEAPMVYDWHFSSNINFLPCVFSD